MSTSTEQPAPPPSASTGTGRRGLVLAVVAAILVALLGSAGYAAYRALSGSGTQPAEALPGNAVAYLRIDLDPSAEQKVSALRLMQRFPAFEELTGITDANEDLRRRAFEVFAQSNRCSGLDFDDDISPWLGERAGLAVLPPAAGESDPDVALAVQVKDVEAAEDGLQALAVCTGDDVPPHATVGEDYLLFAATQASATEYATAATSEPLSQNPVFSADMARLGDQGVVSGWVSIKAAVDAIPAGMLPPGVGAKDIKDVKDGSAAVALRFGSDHLELVGVMTGGKTPRDVPANPVVDLPDSTFVALSASGGGAHVDQMWKPFGDLLARSGQSLDVLAGQVENETGLKLPADLETLLGENVTVALDSERLHFARLAIAPDPSAVRLGALFTTDPDAFHAVLDKLRRYAASQGAELPLETADGDGSVAVATSRAYARALQADGGLGETATFATAVPDASSADSVFFVNFDVVQAQVIALMRQGGAPQSAVDNVVPLSALGLSSHVVEDGVYEIRMRLSVN